MGSTCLYEKPRNVKEYLNDLHTWESDTVSYRVLDSAIVAFRTYYAAVERTTKATGEVVISAAVVLMTYHKTGEEFCYKEMSEDCGPYQVKCPMRILELLSDTENEYAIKWREACLAYHEQRVPSKGLKHGDIVKFNRPMRFNNGCSFTEMRALKANRKMRFTPVDDPYSKYRIPKSTLASYMA